MTTDKRITVTFDSDRISNTHDFTNNELTAEKLTPMLDLLGDGWTAVVSWYRSISLHYKGGKDFPNGYTLSAYAEERGSGDVPKSWKFSWHIELPQSELREDEFSDYRCDHRNDRQGISISNPKAAVTQLQSRVMVNAVSLTEEARQFKAERAQMRAQYEINHARLNALTGSDYRFDIKRDSQTYHAKNAKVSWLEVELRMYGKCKLSVSELSIERLEKLYTFINTEL